MSHPRPVKRLVVRWAAVALAYALALAVVPSLPASVAGPAGGAASAQEGQLPQIPVIAPGSAYRQTNLVSDWPGIAPVQDPLLVNPWGISLTGSSPFWVANNGTSTSTLYRETATLPLVKNPGLAGITIPGGLPTGTVANTGGAMDFVVTSGMASASNGGNFFLYAADFANGKIDVYNSSFALQPEASFPFADPTIPTAMANNRYHPFNIQAIGSSLYVAYAKVGPMGLDEEGVGNGFVRRFNTAGVRDLTFGINN